MLLAILLYSAALFLGLPDDSAQLLTLSLSTQVGSKLHRRGSQMHGEYAVQSKNNWRLLNSCAAKCHLTREQVINHVNN